MPNALVTGPVEGMSEMSIALKMAGFDVVTADSDSGLIPGDMAFVDCYVQLASEPPPAEDAFGCVHAVVETLLRRFDTTAHVARLLTPQARVVLVADRPTARAAALDERLLRLLSMAVLADHGRDGVWVAVVDGIRTPTEIAAFARSEAPSWAAYASMAPELGFADWRNEVICLTASLEWER